METSKYSGVLVTVTGQAHNLEILVQIRAPQQAKASYVCVAQSVRAWDS